MEIRYKVIDHERCEDAPFVGALISAIGCNIKCKNCFNKALKSEHKYPIMVSDSKEIAMDIKSNPFNEGVIFGGLEWSEQPLELVELAKECSELGLKVMIYTGLELSEFQTKIGVACADKVGYTELLNKQMLTDQDRTVFSYIGSMVLDYYIKEDYYIKTGKYDETRKCDDREPFGVKLASENQYIYRIKKQEE